MILFFDLWKESTRETETSDNTSTPSGHVTENEHRLSKNAESFIYFTFTQLIKLRRQSWSGSIWLMFLRLSTRRFYVIFVFVSIIQAEHEGREGRRGGILLIKLAGRKEGRAWPGRGEEKMGYWQRLREWMKITYCTGGRQETKGEGRKNMDS